MEKSHKKWLWGVAVFTVLAGLAIWTYPSVVATVIGLIFVVAWNVGWLLHEKHEMKKLRREAWEKSSLS